MKTAHVMLPLFVVSCTGGALHSQVAATATASVVIQTVDIQRTKTNAQNDWTNQQVEGPAHGRPMPGGGETGRPWSGCAFVGPAAPGEHATSTSAGKSRAGKH